MSRVFHTALAVESITRSRRFYQAVFDLEVRAEGERSEIGVKFMMLEDSNGSGVEFFETKEHQPLEEDLMDFSRGGIKHLAFVVDDLDVALEKAVEHGAEVIWPPKKGVTVKRIAFVADPDGIPIELVELDEQ